MKTAIISMVLIVIAQVAGAQIMEPTIYERNLQVIDRLIRDANLDENTFEFIQNVWGDRSSDMIQYDFRTKRNKLKDKLKTNSRYKCIETTTIDSVLNSLQKDVAIHASTSSQTELYVPNCVCLSSY